MFLSQDVLSRLSVESFVVFAWTIKRKIFKLAKGQLHQANKAIKLCAVLKL